MRAARTFLLGIALAVVIVGPAAICYRATHPQVCDGKQCTCAGKRHMNGHLYAYECECCPSAGCKPDAEMNLDRKGADKP